jgi:hypothetical protein
MQASLVVATLVFLLSPFSASTFTAIQSTGSTVTGVVVDETLIDQRRPISGATITLYSTRVVSQTRSDARGRFEFTEVPEGSYQLEVVGSGFASKTMDISVGSGKPASQPYLIALRIGNPNADCGNFDSTSYERNKAISGRRLAGVVFEEHYSKKPLAGTVVRLFNSDGAELSAQQTNEQGEFLFLNIEPGRYSLKASHAGYNDLKTRVFWITRENQTRITLEPIKTGMIVVCQ